MRWEGAAKRQGGQAHCWQPGVGSRAWGSKHCRGWEGSWSNRSSQRSRTKCQPLVNQPLPIPRVTFWLANARKIYAGQIGSRLPSWPNVWLFYYTWCTACRLICNEMPFWICIWAYVIVLNPLNSHVIQWNCRHAHAAPVTSCVSHLEQSLQRGANGWTALLCLTDNEPLTSIILFQSSRATIQGQGVCRKWRYLPLRLSLNH